MNRPFTDADRLRLLQLMTRRAMGERQIREAQQEGLGRDTESDAGVQPTAVKDKSRWRLLPEGVSLYDWQRECLPRWLSRGRGTIKVATGGGKTFCAFVNIAAAASE